MRRQLAAVIALVAALTVLVSGALSAQHPRRKGFWMEYGRGAGNIHINCASCLEPTTTYGETAYFRLGGGISRKVHWGLEFFSLLDRNFIATGERGAVTLENSAISPVVLWYPWSGGVFFKGGMGITNGEVITPATEDAPEIVASGYGSGFTFGIGLDVPIHKSISITTNFGVYYSALGDFAIGGNLVDDVITTVYQANFAVTLR